MSLQILIVMSCLFVSSLHSMRAEVNQNNYSKRSECCSPLPQDTKYLTKLLDYEERLFAECALLHQYYHEFFFGKQNAMCAHCKRPEMFLSLLQQIKGECSVETLQLIAWGAAVYVLRSLEKPRLYRNIATLEKEAFQQAIKFISRSS